MYQLNFKFDIIFLTETRISKKSSSAFNPGKINGYSKYIEQLGTTRNSGCGFYVSNHLKFHPRKDLKFHHRKDLELYFYDKSFRFECKWIEILNKNKRNTLLASVYRYHPHKNDLPFLDYLKNTLKIPNWKINRY